MTEPLRLYPAWRQVEAELLAAGLQDGATIPMQYLRKALGVQDPRELDGDEALREQLQFNRAMGWLCDSLLKNYRIKLRVVPTVGYMVVPPDEQTFLAVKERGAEMQNALRRGLDEVTYVRTELLNDQQRRENADAQAKLAALSSVAKGTLQQPQLTEE